MDLTRFLRRAAVVGLAAWLAGCGDDNPASFSEDAVILPATLLEALPIADAVARKWNEDAFLGGLGGGFTVADAEGRSWNHSYVYYARFGPTTLKKLSIDFINGAPWTLESGVGTPPSPFPSLDFIDSGEAVRVCVQLAAELNQNGQAIPAAERYAPRLISRAVWPEPGANATPDTIAWRVDFLVLMEINHPDGTTSPPVWFSVARFYLDPWTGQFLGNAASNPIVPPQPELYREIVTLP